VERARIYYSHLTFHEYFAAREIVSVLTPGIKDSFVPASELRLKIDGAFFLLSVGMLRW